MMRACRFVYSGAAGSIRNRRILDESVDAFHDKALEGKKGAHDASWIITLEDTLLFDRRALDAIESGIARYDGRAAELEFFLNAGEAAFREYYSHKPVASEGGLVKLPILARRVSGEKGVRDRLVIALPEYCHDIHTPAGLCPPFRMSLPRMLLTYHSSEFDILFANQIAVMNELVCRVERSPRAWLRSFLMNRSCPWRQRAALAYQDIHPSAYVHPTAVVEGAVIGARAHVGAHCTVRYSMVCEEAKLYDGAKVEFSVIGRRSWLMHDLALYRCHVEDDVFLIHGPYQFSGFQTGSAAFATIMMDYRPDGKPIKIETADGLRPYGGRFLGAILRAGAKTLGGSLIAPGALVPESVWLAPDTSQVHVLSRARQFPRLLPVPPLKSEDPAP